jgi:hypothetical protein
MALGGRRLRADDEVKFLCAKMAGRATTNFFLKGRNETAQVMARVYRGAGRMCRKVGIAFF